MLPVRIMAALKHLSMQAPACQSQPWTPPLAAAVAAPSRGSCGRPLSESWSFCEELCARDGSSCCGRQNLWRSRLRADLYANCGSIVDAQKVFDVLSHRDAAQWNGLLAAYVKQGQAEKALKLYEQMQEQGVNGNARTFITVLQACRSLAEKENAVHVNGRLVKAESLRKGRKVHSEARVMGFELDVYVGSTLISMYTKCGSLLDAENLFDRLLQRTVVSWNALLAGYASQGHGDKALHLYSQMQEEGTSPNDRTFVSMLQACGSIAEGEAFVPVNTVLVRAKTLEMGKSIHAACCSRAYAWDVFIGNALISLYGKCGSLCDAQIVFDGLVHQTVVSWTAMLGACLQHGQAEKCLQLYGHMLEQGGVPNTWTFVRALQACCNLAEKEDGIMVDAKLLKGNALCLGRAIHAEVERRGGCGSELFVGNALVTMYGKCRSIVDAHILFEGLSQQNTVSWTALLTAFAQQGEGEKALQFYHQMRGACVTPVARTFGSVLQACRELAWKEDVVLVDDNSLSVLSLQRGKTIHAESCRMGCETDDFVASNLIGMYAKCGSIVDAENVFDGLPQQNVVLWNAMLAGYAHHGQGKKALQLYGWMLEDSIAPDETTFLHVLQVCGNLGAIDTCIQIHNNLISKQSKLSLRLATTLTSAYGDCARMEDAQDVFNSILQPDVVLWNALIAGYARQGNCEASVRCYDDMLLANVKPSRVTFLSLLSSCSHAGLVDEGVAHFEAMTKCHGIIPEVDHYASMVDLLGRAGNFIMLEDLLSKMPTQPDMSMWLCLLGACRKHGNVVLGQQAFEGAVSLQPRHPVAYTLMENIFANAGMWESAKLIRELRKRAAVLPIVGHSWIEHEQDVYAFDVREVTHQQQSEIYELIEKLCSSCRISSTEISATPYSKVSGYAGINHRDTRPHLHNPRNGA